MQHRVKSVFGNEYSNVS